MRSAANCAFSKLEDFSREPEDTSERYQRELENRVAEALEQGYQRGHEAGRNEAEAASNARIEDLTASFKTDMELRQSDWQSQTGSALADALQAQMDSISEMLERHVASLMKPLIKQVLYESALQQFHQALDSVLEKGVAVEIRGSSDLVRGAEARLASTSRAVTFVTSDEAAIEIKCDETTLSANFADWSRKIEESVA
ncbi:MAG: hypothetical protein IKE66_05050 [Hyphomicrobium sp.]|nr:hypothetical protein [Hyphomicrobium sp.]